MNFWYYSKQVDYDTPVGLLAQACVFSTSPRSLRNVWKELQHSLGKQA